MMHIGPKVSLVLDRQWAKKLEKNGLTFFLVLSESCAEGRKGLKAG